MATQKEGKVSKKRKTKKTKKQIEYCQYIIKIQDWNVSYSMRLDVEGRWSYGPYWEHHDLEIIGLGLAPERVKDKTIKLTFMADRRYPAFIAGIQEAGYEPRCLGGLTVRGQVNEYLGSLPADIIQTLPFLMQAKKILYIMLTGTVPYRGSADIKGIHFDHEYFPEDW